MSGLRIDVNLANDVMLEQLAVKLLERAARGVLQHEDVREAAISITLLGDPEIAHLNARYLQHEGPTDVIAFPLYQAGEQPVGDIYIGLEQARRQADELNVPVDAELVRLAIHGTLHVLGYDHPKDGAREGSEMWQLQETILQQVLQH